MIHAESAVQRGIVRFCNQAVVPPFVLACHDRAKEHRSGQHLFEAARGIRTGWPDAEISVPAIPTVRVEIKAPGKKPQPGGQQERVGNMLRAVGQPWEWANSVSMFGEAVAKHGVPLVATWRMLAALQDELVAADIRKQEAKRDGMLPRGKPIRQKPTPGRVRRVEGARARVLF